MTTLMSGVAVAFIVSASVAGAQSDAYWEFRPMAGIAIPTGAHRQAFPDVALVGLQSSVSLTSAWDLVASFGVQTSTTKYSAPDNHATVLVYNFGLERLLRAQPSRVDEFVPFVGGGVGGRAFHYRSSSLEGGACYAGYGNGGVFYERSRTTVRFEARENVFCFRQPFTPFGEVTRSEASLSLSMGVRF
jgi:hypothetical protein